MMLLQAKVLNVSTNLIFFNTQKLAPESRSKKMSVSFPATNLNILSRKLKWHSSIEIVSLDIFYPRSRKLKERVKSLERQTLDN